MSATEARTMVQRKELFQRYARDAGLDADQLAVRLMLSPARILDLLCGRAPISNELATHIEEMLQLPASWLDQGGALEPGDPPMIDVPSQAPNQAPPPVQPPPPTTATQPAAAAPAVVASPTATVVDKKQLHEHRRLNLTMLTTERGSKNRLAQLAGTSGSRISLMTSARKPVSDPFAFAIEDGLGLPRGWLDQPRSADSVPAAVWQSLLVDSAAATAGASTIASAAPATIRPGAPDRPRQARSAADGVRVASGPSARVSTNASAAAPSYPPLAPPAAAGTPAPQVAHNTPAIPVAIAAAPANPALATLSAGGTGLFDKPAGQCGPIAEALAKTILNLSSTDKLSESRAFQLLGVLLSETSPPV
ncbi:MAG: hypothetical protein QMB75_06805 [Thauera sp.]|nr:MAG: hypothetical protein EKK55_17615 [Rhodocyclaceae bacterium]